MKLMILAASLLFSVFAQANDGSFIYVDVLGINPQKMAPVKDTGTSVDIYGNDAIRFAELFSYAPIHDAYQMDFISNSYNVSIWCPKTYIRPTTGEERNDTMCSIWLNSFSPESLQEIKDNMDSMEVFAPQGTINNGSYGVLGINPNGVAKGVLFQIYGDNAYVMNENLAGGNMTLQSKAYKITVGCVKNYVRPTNGEVRDDYMCTFSLQ